MYPGCSCQPPPGRLWRCQEIDELPERADGRMELELLQSFRHIEDQSMLGDENISRNEFPLPYPPADRSPDLLQETPDLVEAVIIKAGAVMRWAEAKQLNTERICAKPSQQLHGRGGHGLGALVFGGVFRIERESPDLAKTSERLKGRNVTIHVEELGYAPNTDELFWRHAGSGKDHVNRKGLVETFV